MKRDERSPLATPAIDEIWRRAAAQRRLHDRAHRRRVRDQRRAGRDRDRRDAGARRRRRAGAARVPRAVSRHHRGRGRARRSPTGGSTTCPSTSCASTRACALQAHLADRVRPARARWRRRRRTATTTRRCRAIRSTARDGDDAAVRARRRPRARFDASAWRAPIEQALAATAAATRGRGARGRIRSASRSDRRPRPAARAPGSTTAGAATRSRAAGRARPPNGDGARTARGHPACAHWEPPVDCRTCGACCREAYHSVTVSMRDPVVWQEPDLIVRHGPRFEIRREGPRCAALADRRRDRRRSYTCAIYENRPRPCREFAAGGRHCLDARRRVGLSATPRRAARRT